MYGISMYVYRRYPEKLPRQCRLLFGFYSSTVLVVVVLFFFLEVYRPKLLPRSRVCYLVGYVFVAGAFTFRLLARSRVFCSNKNSSCVLAKSYLYKFLLIFFSFTRYEILNTGDVAVDAILQEFIFFNFSSSAACVNTNNFSKMYENPKILYRHKQTISCNLFMIIIILHNVAG